MTEEILETFPQVFCFSKSRINENGGNETPKKVVEADRCLIFSTVVAKKEKLYIFGKSLIDFSALLKRECEKLLS